MKYNYTIAKLIKIRNSIFPTCSLYFSCDNNQIIKIKSGKQLGKDLSVGDTYSIGYANNKLINIRKESYPDN